MANMPVYLATPFLTYNRRKTGVIVPEKRPSHPVCDTLCRFDDFSLIYFHLYRHNVLRDFNTFAPFLCHANV